MGRFSLNLGSRYTTQKRVAYIFEVIQMDSLSLMIM